MGLKKAQIQAMNEKGDKIGDPVEVLFNPTEYSIETSNQFQSTSIPGLITPLLHFTSGNSQTLTMDLFFDTYTDKNGEDVRNYTGKITSLMDINSELHAPPICEFVWGDLQFRAVLERVSQKFTMFLETGVPVRSTLNVTFKEYRSLTEQFQHKPRHSSDRTKRRIITEGDNLWLMAEREYGDPGLWRVIAKANNIHNPRTLEVGKELILPPLE